MDPEFKKFFQSFLENLVSQIALTIVKNWSNETDISNDDRVEIIRRIQERSSQIARNVINELESKGIYKPEDIEKQEPLIRQLIGTAIREGFLKDENVH